ncbi:nucleotidyltransferase domain-containing protein [Candidatus Woesearchaeota archaeon]|nr:nucleotidyltransferase domain-containing protein [Candidatus Woesearchaeota archaeon]
MEFKIEKRDNPNTKSYSKEDYELARKFGEELKKEVGDFLKAVILFGSAARASAHTQIYERDIDVLVIVNDLTLILNKEVITAYRIIAENAASRVSKRLHITTLRLTAFWEYVRNGDPIVINMLRDGVPLIDEGFFEPIQVLLGQGRIRPSQEAIWTYFARAPMTVNSSKWHVMQGVIDLYWAVIDSSHAALMSLGEIPPTPEHVADLIDEKMVKTKMLDKRYADVMRNFYKISKMIMHREIKEVSGQEYDKYLKEAQAYVGVMQKFIEKREQSGYHKRQK